MLKQEFDGTGGDGSCPHVSIPGVTCDYWKVTFEFGYLLVISEHLLALFELLLAIRNVPSAK